MSPLTGIALCFLGPPYVLRDGRPIAGLTGGKMLCVLAYLASEPERVHRRETLADLFWPDHSMQQARAHLRHLLHHLNRLLVPDADFKLLRLSRDTVQFVAHPGTWCDLAEFHQAALLPPLSPGERDRLKPLETRMDLYRGTFLEGLEIVGDDFGRWVEQQRDRCQRRAVTLADRLVQGWRDTGDAARALRWAQRRVAIDPLDENGYCSLLAQFAQIGDRTGVRVAYDQLCMHLRHELDVEPSPKTREFYRKLIESLPHNFEPDRFPAWRRSEVRPVTVLCCGFSPTASARTTETAQLSDACYQQNLEIIRQHGGHGLKVSGRAWLMAFFGLPAVREDAAQRAAHCAFALLDNCPDAVGVRIGIHSGAMLHDGIAADPDVEGTLSSVARRLQSAAGDGEVLITDQSWKALHGYFDATPIGRDIQSSFEVTIYRLLTHTGARTRLEARPPKSIWLGRDAELNCLREHWQRSRRGSGRMVQVRGEAGVGKSRLAHEMKVRLEPDTVVLELYCSSERDNSPFDPFIDLIERQAGVALRHPPSERREQVAQWLQTQHPNLSSDDRDILANWPDLTARFHKKPDVVRRRLFDAATALVASWTTRGPVWMLVDDVHHADPSTVEWLGLLALSMDALPILVLLASRNEPMLWDANPPRAVPLTLSPLSAADTRALVHTLSEGIPLEDPVVDRIVAISEGLPFYAEELTRLELDALAAPTERPGGTMLSDSADLHHLLAARIDRLGETRRLAQCGAVLGPTIRLGWLVTVAGLPEPEIDPLTRRLISLDFWRESGDETGPTGEVRVRHVLLQEALYQSIPLRERRELHRRAAETFASSCPDLAESHPEIAARHWSLAGYSRAAARFRLIAGKLAASRGAYREAVAHFRAGLADIAHEPLDEESRTIELGLVLELCGPLTMVDGYWTPALQTLVARAQALSQDREAEKDVFKLLWGQWVFSLFHGRLKESRAISERLAEAADDSGIPILIAGANYARCDTLFWLGRFRTSLSFATEVLAQLPHFSLEEQYAQFGCTLGALARTKWLIGSTYLGRHTETAAALAESLDATKDAPDLHDRVCILVAACQIHFFHRQLETVLDFAEQALALTDREDLAHWRIILDLYRFSALAVTGDRQALSALRSASDNGATVMPAKTASLRFILGVAQCLIRHFDDALATLRWVLLRISQTGEAFILAETFHLLGECSRHLREPAEETEFYFQRALRISQKQGCKTLAERIADTWSQRNE